MRLTSVFATFTLVALAPSAAVTSVALQQPATTIVLNGSYGPPDGSVVIPVDLKAPDGVQVGEIEVRLTIPSALLTFDRAVPSGLSEAAGVQVAVEVKPGEGADTFALRITIAGRVEGDSRRPIPNGQIAHFVFQIAKTTMPDSVIPLTPKVAARTAGTPPATVEPIQAPESRIVVSSPAVISCFFYMH